MGREVKFEKQVNKLAKRTGLEADLVRQLPSEKITSYFNETGDASRFNMISQAISGPVAATAGLSLAAMGVAPAIMLPLAATALVCSLISAYGEKRKLDSNEDACKSIQRDLAQEFKEVASGKPDASGHAPVNSAPTKNASQDLKL